MLAARAAARQADLFAPHPDALLIATLPRTDNDDGHDVFPNRSRSRSRRAPPHPADRRDGNDNTSNNNNNNNSRTLCRSGHVVRRRRFPLSVTTRPPGVARTGGRGGTARRVYYIVIILYMKFRCSHSNILFQ